MFRRRLILIVFAMLLLAQCGRSEAEKSDPLADLAESALRAYLQINTTNPPGNESAGARYLQALLQREGIETRLIGRDPQRQSLYARLASGRNTPAVLLLSHIDVVPADASEWTVPPFSGEKRGGYLWGRGALDIKSLTIAQLIALIDLKRRAVSLQRDVILLASADEESGGARGVEALLRDEPRLFANVGLVLNEGGANKTAVDRLTEWGIEVQQKVPLWIRLTARGDAGHAALGARGSDAVSKLLEVLDALRRMPEATAPSTPDALLTRDTLTISTLRAGEVVNSVPARASADIDCRVAAGHSPDALLQQITGVVAGRAEVSILTKGAPAVASRIDTADYALISKALGAAARGAKVKAIATPGSTDSRFFRARGVVAYGFSPFKLSYYDYDTIHGIDEKIRVAFFAEGVVVMRDLLRTLATSRS